MDTFSELIQGVQDDLTIDNNSTLYPLALVKRAINRAYPKCGALYRWPRLEDAKKTSTQANIEYYDCPDTWRPDSIWRLEVDGDQWGEDPDGSPMSYDDYLVFRADDNNANSTEKKWANQWMRYFIFPVPTSVGNNNIHIWGQKNVETLSADGDTTIFSYSMPECNDAIVLEAVAILKAKGEEEKSGEFRSVEAKGILANAWNKIKQEQAKYEKVQPFFDVEDMFASNGSALKEDIEKYGNF